MQPLTATPCEGRSLSVGEMMALALWLLGGLWAVQSLLTLACQCASIPALPA